MLKSVGLIEGQTDRQTDCHCRELHNLLGRDLNYIYTMMKFKIRGCGKSTVGTARSEYSECACTEILGPQHN